MLGVMYSGRVIVPLNAVAGDSALSYVIDHSDCRAIFVDAKFREQFAGVLAALPVAVRVIDIDVNDGPEWAGDGSGPSASLPNIDEQDDAILIYTSGTTGRPKGVLLNHENVNVRIGEGRSVLRGNRKQYDIIQIYSNHTTSTRFTLQSRNTAQKRECRGGKQFE